MKDFTLYTSPDATLLIYPGLELKLGVHWLETPCYDVLFGDSDTNKKTKGRAGGGRVEDV